MYTINSNDLVPYRIFVHRAIQTEGAFIKLDGKCTIKVETDGDKVRMDILSNIWITTLPNYYGEDISLFIFSNGYSSTNAAAYKSAIEQGVDLPPEVKKGDAASFNPTSEGVVFFPLAIYTEGELVWELLRAFASENELFVLPLSTSNEKQEYYPALYDYLVDELYIKPRVIGLKVLGDFLEKMGVPLEVRQEAKAITDEIIHEIAPISILKSIPIIPHTYKST